MFRLKPASPQPVKLQFSESEISEDVNFLCLNEDYRNKLYLSINDKPPLQDYKVTKIEKLLQVENQDLQHVLKELQRLQTALSVHKNEVLESITQIKSELNS